MCGVSSVFGLLLAEGMVRVVRPQLTYRFPRGLFVSDPITSYGLAPGFDGELDTPEYRTALRINAQGWREERPIGAKAPGTVRIMMVGDSFTMGVGVEGADTLARQLERSLDGAPNMPRIECVNAGVPGYGTEQEVAQLEARGLSVQPDIALLNVFIGNDIADNGTKPQIVKDGYLVAAAAADSLQGWRAQLLRLLSLHSQLYHLVDPWIARLGGRGNEERAALAAGFRELYEPGASGEGWRATAAAIQHFAAVTQRARVRGAVVLIPERMQVSPPLWQQVLQETGLDDTVVRPEAPTRHLRMLAERAGLPVLDLTPALATNGDGGKWYFPQDHHLTAAGTTQAVTALAPFVRTLIGSGTGQ